MSKPTPRKERMRWHRQALEDLHLHLETEVNPDDPQEGFYKRKLVKGGVFVPARIWWYSPIDENGDLTGDEVLQAEVDGKYADAYEQWQWLCAHPISEAEFNFLTAQRQWAQKHAPHEPYADPRKPVDWLNGVPTPTFNQGQKQ